ncbi:hypothetical protein BDV93DRAFT_513354 [Ceratobasidium sp. AG-I]|nr:hypothetical protein BDV93DRAFT_513354 [Ceratobasidium sp. AG-I]
MQVDDPSLSEPEDNQEAYPASAHDSDSGIPQAESGDEEMDRGMSDHFDDWSQIDTPPHTPPPSPPPEHTLLDDGEYNGFVNVNHEDLELYERWYAEDCEHELRELILSMIAAASTAWRLQADIRTIPIAEPVDGRALYLDPEMSKLMRYRHEYEQREGVIEDIFDSKRYKYLCKENIVINGVDTGREYFEGRRDIALSFLGDGVQIFKRGHKATDTCWPIILQNLNLPGAN